MAGNAGEILKLCNQGQIKPQEESLGYTSERLVVWKFFTTKVQHQVYSTMLKV